jgi:predicted deacetylase
VSEFAVSVHDVAPHTWTACQRLLEAVRPVGAPITWLVTPHHHRRTRIDADPAFVAALRARVAAGDEIALHGYYHVDDALPPRSPTAWFERRVLTAGEGEFAALTCAAAESRIASGLALLVTVGLAPTGFVAPAWLMSPGTRRALRTSGLAYACSRDALLPLPDGPPVVAPSLVWSARSAWRRRASLVWNRARLVRCARAPLLRVALHPADAEHPQVLRAWTELMGRLADSRVAVLESRWLRA